MIQEVPPIDPEKIIISLEKKTILKFYIRLYFLFIHNFRKLIEKTNSSGSQGFSKQQKKSILEQYFDEDINNINRLSNSADMFFIKPYFEHLCNNSYDDDCNDYKKFFNKMINYEDDPDKITKDVINQLKSYVNKFNSLSLTEEKIEKIRKLLNKNDGKKLSPGDIQNILSTDDSNQNPESLDTDDTSRTGTGTETETETEDKTMSKSDWLKDTRYESSNTPSFSYQQSFDNIPDNIKILNQNAHIANHLAVEAHTKLINYKTQIINDINASAIDANQLAVNADTELSDYKTQIINDISASAIDANKSGNRAENLLNEVRFKRDQFPPGNEKDGFYDIYNEYFILHKRKREDDLRSIKQLDFKAWESIGMFSDNVKGIPYPYNEPANDKELELVEIKLKKSITPRILYYTNTHFILASYKKNSSGYHFIDYSENPKNYVIIERNQFPDNKRKTPNVKADESAEKIKEYAKSANTYADSGETKLNDARQTQVIKDDATEAKNNADSGETKLNDARQTQVKEDANSAKTYADNGAGKIAEFIIHANNDKFNSTHGKYKEIYNKYIQYILGGQNATQPDLLNYSYKFISNTTTVGYLIQNNNDIRETGVMGAPNNLTTIDITGNSDILNVIYRTDDGIIVKGYKESGPFNNIKYIKDNFDYNYNKNEIFLMIILKENLIENSRAADAAAQAAQEAEDAKKMLDKVATIQLKSHADKADKAAEDAKKMLDKVATIQLKSHADKADKAAEDAKQMLDNVGTIQIKSDADKADKAAEDAKKMLDKVATIQLPNAPPLPPPGKWEERVGGWGQLKDW